jgi:hypothetical protein
MNKTYSKFFVDLEDCFNDDFFKLPTSTAHDLTIENDGLKVTMRMTEELMKELVSKCVHIYGLEAVVKSAVESTNEIDAE